MKRNDSELKINEPEKNKNQGYSKYEKTWKKKRQHWLGTNGQKHHHLNRHFQYHPVSLKPSIISTNIHVPYVHKSSENYGSNVTKKGNNERGKREGHE